MVISSILPDIRLFSVSGIRPDIRHVKSGIRLDTGYKKGGLSGRISGASLFKMILLCGQDKCE
jgi:hypothetical protein